MSLKHKTLKQGIFHTTQNGGHDVERYIIENKKDILKMAKKMELNPSTVKIWYESLEKGYIIIVTDAHPILIYPRYCFESKDHSHPSNFVRIKTL